MKLKRILISLMVFMLSCGKDNDLGSLILNPEIATLVYPENLTQCLEGIVLSQTESEVTFRWNASDNTDNYELHITNILNGFTEVLTTENTEIEVRLTRGQPYSWFVVSQLDGSSNSATSEVWSFYNAGDSIISYIPFPAEAVNPISGAVLVNINTISLSWQASDLDNDISTYDLYFGSSEPVELFQSDLTQSTAENIPVSQGDTYFWKIMTKDIEGNESLSETFYFEVN